MFFPTVWVLPSQELCQFGFKNSENLLKQQKLTGCAFHSNEPILTELMRWLGSPRFRGCLNSVHGRMLTCRGPSSRLHQLTRLDVGELSGWRLSFSQSRQTGHALFNDYPSICPLSLISVRKPAKRRRKYTRRSSVNPIQPSSSMLALVEVISSLFNQI